MKKSASRKLSTLGVQVHRSPKFHSELAREGIEYTWGYTKNFYPLKKEERELPSECTICNGTE